MVLKLWLLLHDLGSAIRLTRGYIATNIGRRIQLSIIQLVHSHFLFINARSCRVRHWLLLRLFEEHILYVAACGRGWNHCALSWWRPVQLGNRFARFVRQQTLHDQARHIMLLLMHRLAGVLMPEWAQVLLSGSLGCNLMSLIPLYYCCGGYLSRTRRQYLFCSRLNLKDLVLLRKTERSLVYTACLWWWEIWHGGLRFDVLTWFHWWGWVILLSLRSHSFCQSW